MREVWELLKGKDLISLHDLSTDEIEEILSLGSELKALQKAGVQHHLLEGKTLGMIFEKASTRTRVSFETGMFQLGGQALFLSDKELQIGRGEPIEDTARVMSRYLDGVMIRTFAHENILNFAKWADVPVINGLTDLLHPCQVLADLMTIREHLGKNLKGLKLAYIGDGNNMANSLMYGCAKMGMNFMVATPKGYEPDNEVFENAKKDAKATGSLLMLTHEPADAARDADVLYTDVWVSMGEEAEREKRRRDLAGYQINRGILQFASKRAIVMHCLPAHRGEEIAADVFEDNADVIFDEAENRLHAQKAVMALLMGD